MQCNKDAFTNNVINLYYMVLDVKDQYLEISVSFILAVFDLE